MELNNTEQYRHPRYFHWSLRALLSVVAAHLIVVERQKKSVWVILHQLNYYVAMVFSVVVCIGLMYLVHFFTKRLDRRMPWMISWPKRGVLQLLLGVCLILLLDVILVRGYFWVFNNDFQKSGYMRIEFPVVRWMVVALNMVYVAWFFIENYNWRTEINSELVLKLRDLSGKMEVRSKYPKAMEVKLGSKVLVVSLSEVVCFEREENVGYVWMDDGRKYNMDYKMQELAEIMDPALFFQTSRAVMFSVSFIIGYEKVKNQQAMVILRSDVDVQVSKLVSRHRSDGFKKLMEQLM